MAIISAEEVLKYSTASENSDLNQICKISEVKEQMVFITSECLGLGFYEDLKSDVFIPSPVVAFNPLSAYSVGTFISYNGQTYEVAIATTAGETPTNAAYKFRTPKKFNNADFNTLWNDHLARIIAIEIQRWILVDSHAGLQTSIGLNNPEGEGFKRSSELSSNIKSKNLKSYQDEAAQIMAVFLSRNLDKYPTTKIAKEERERCACTNQAGNCAKNSRSPLMIGNIVL